MQCLERVCLVISFFHSVSILTVHPSWPTISSHFPTNTPDVLSFSLNLVVSPDLYACSYIAKVFPRFYCNFLFFCTKISPAPQNKKNPEIFTVHSYCLNEVHMQWHVPDWSYIQCRWVEKDAFTKVTYSSRMSSLFRVHSCWMMSSALSDPI